MKTEIVSILKRTQNEVANLIGPHEDDENVDLAWDELRKLIERLERK